MIVVQAGFGLVFMNYTFTRETRSDWFGPGLTYLFLGVLLRNDFQGYKYV